jgi:hypothetical protein
MSGSRLAILVHQGRNPTQPYPTFVIRTARHAFSSALRLGHARRCSVPCRKRNYVGSASPDGVDGIRRTPSFANTAGRISPMALGPAPRFFSTRAISSASGTASS